MNARLSYFSMYELVALSWDMESTMYRFVFEDTVNPARLSTRSTAPDISAYSCERGRLAGEVKVRTAYVPFAATTGFTS